LSLRHRIVITGGGTGGHIYPALSVYEQLKDLPDVEAILYIGAKGHLEERLAAERKIEFVGLGSVGLPRKLSPALFAWPFKMTAAANAAGQAMKRFSPTAVIGTGGYASAPPLLVAKLSSIPYAVHEPDAHPGLVNRVFASSASLCSLGMEGARERIKSDHGTVVVNGNPIASRFLSPPSKEQARKELSLKPDLRTLLITGGSQGAQAINQAVLQALPGLLAIEPPIQILHQVGEKNFAAFEALVSAAASSELKRGSDELSRERYRIVPYINDLSVAYAACDAAICRAGAMTIAELGVSGTPAIFVPYPFAAQNHQTHNARSVEAAGAATVIMQNDVSGDLLASTVESLLQDQSRLESMRSAMQSLGRPNAASDLAKQIVDLSTKYQLERANS
jgi:UDP-N-acetylglucosamine--N-acetylmuramyl-(pentapeptide) pyrophosphoryl-undecaprenol N-acetylglucosamine transferase